MSGSGTQKKKKSSRTDKLTKSDSQIWNSPFKPMSDHIPTVPQGMEHEHSKQIVLFLVQAVSVKLPVSYFLHWQNGDTAQNKWKYV